VPAFFLRYFACTDISLDGDTVVLHTEDLPPHLSAYYIDGDPNHVAWDDRGGDYHQNPNTILPQDITIRVPMAPVEKGITVTADLIDQTAGNSDEEFRLGPIGVALDSVALFTGTAAPNDDIDDEQWTFDTYLAHPAPGGTYHYHAPAPGPLEVLAAADRDDAEIYGILCDGTLVLGCTEPDGTAAADADFDAQNGHVHDLVDLDGTDLFVDRYHVHLCDALGGDAYTPEIQYYETCE
jgi:hypothetical protein